MAENKGFSLKTFGMPWWLAGAIAVIVIAAAATRSSFCRSCRMLRINVIHRFDL